MHLGLLHRFFAIGLCFVFLIAGAKPEPWERSRSEFEQQIANYYEQIKDDSSIDEEEVISFVKLAKFEPGFITEKWMKLVKSEIQNARCPAKGYECVLRSIAMVLHKSGLKYGFSRIYPIADFLEKGWGDCKHFSILVVTTLVQLGFRAVLVKSQEHVVPAMVIDEEAIASKDYTRGLLALEATSAESGDINRMLEKGRIFMMRCIPGVHKKSLFGQESSHEIVFEIGRGFLVRDRLIRRKAHTINGLPFGF
jgi:hypothetical protein